MCGSCPPRGLPEHGDGRRRERQHSDRDDEWPGDGLTRAPLPRAGQGEQSAEADPDTAATAARAVASAREVGDPMLVSLALDALVAHLVPGSAPLPGDYDGPMERWSDL